MAESRVQVGVRIRPRITAAERLQAVAVRKVGDNGVSVQLEEGASGNAGPPALFAYDFAIDMDDPQALVYEHCALDAVDALTVGRSATIFAYGQTGSGKTFTVLGKDSCTTEDPDRPPTDCVDSGLFLRIFHDLLRFKRAHTAAKSLNVVISLAALEIYIGKTYDLLQPGKPPVRLISDGDRCQFSGLQLHPIESLRDARKLFATAASMRHTAATAMNDESSRSHAIFLIDCFVAPYTERVPSLSTLLSLSSRRDMSNPPKWTHSRLALADLAGSERLSKSAVSGLGADQAKKINLSLSALGRVLRQMHAGEGHVNFRETELTRVLQDTLSDQKAIVRLLAAVSPTAANAFESQSTLRFANDVKALDRPLGGIDPGVAAVEAEYMAVMRAMTVASQDLRVAVAEGHEMVGPTRFGGREAGGKGIAVRTRAALKEAVEWSGGAAITKERALQHARKSAIRQAHRDATQHAVDELAVDVNAAVSAAAAAKAAAGEARDDLKSTVASLEADEEKETHAAKKAKKARLKAESALEAARVSLSAAQGEQAAAAVELVKLCHAAGIVDGLAAFASADDLEVLSELAESPSHMEPPSRSGAVPDNIAAVAVEVVGTLTASMTATGSDSDPRDNDAAVLLPPALTDALTQARRCLLDEHEVAVAAAGALIAAHTEESVAVTVDLMALIRQRLLLLSLLRRRAAALSAVEDSVAVLETLTNKMNAPANIDKKKVAPLNVVDMSDGVAEDDGGGDVSDIEPVGAVPHLKGAPPPPTRTVDVPSPSPPNLPSQATAHPPSDQTAAAEDESAAADPPPQQVSFMDAATADPEAADAIYDEAYRKGIYDAPGIQREIVEFLIAGTNLVKYGRLGKPKTKRFWVTRGAAKTFHLNWAEPSAIEQHAAARLRDPRRADQQLRRAVKTITLARDKVEGFTLGHSSPVFRRHIRTSVPSQYLSMSVYSEGRSVDFVCPDLPTFEAWAIGLAAITLLEPHFEAPRPLTADHCARFKEIALPGARTLCEVMHIPPDVYFKSHNHVVSYRNSVRESVEKHGGDMDAVAREFRGLIHPPALDARGAILMTKGEVRFLSGLDILRATHLFVHFARCGLIFDPNYLPITPRGPVLRP